jgi:hypothetical protein
VELILKAFLLSISILNLLYFFSRWKGRSIILRHNIDTEFFLSLSSHNVVPSGLLNPARILHLPVLWRSMRQCAYERRTQRQLYARTFTAAIIFVSTPAPVMLIGR